MSSLAQYDKTVLLLPMNGANSGTTFLDYSQWTRKISVVSGAVTSTAQSKYYGSSGYFDGTNDYIWFDGEIDYNWLNFGTGDFTISFWIYLNSTTQSTYATVMASNRGAWTSGAVAIFLGSSRTIKIIGNGLTERSFASALGASQWYHIELARSGTSLKCFIDGTVDASLTDSQSWSFDYAGTNIGRNSWDGVNGYVNCYLQDLILVKGAALHTTDFTPAKLVGTISNGGSGIAAIKDDADAAAIRRIKAIPRGFDASRTYCTTSDSDGRYSLLVPNTACDVLFEDDAAGTQYSDLLVSHVTPS